MKLRAGIFIGMMIIICVNHSIAQKKMSWRKRAKTATEYQEKGDFRKAAAHFKKIASEHPDKLEYRYKAALCFLAFRDYANAAKELEPIQDKNVLFDKVGYKYALALKQSGQTLAAKAAFEAFLVDYQGSEKELYKNIVDNEIRGCNFALKAKDYTHAGITMELLGNQINTPKTEFAPIPFSDNILYFSTTAEGTAKIYRSQKNDGKWQVPQVPHIFLGQMERPHFGNGSFTADGSRFYFTECEVTDQPHCAIYVMEAKNGAWSKPQLLPDYINSPDANTTHPYVVTTLDQEILYFASNRAGGRGGLDLWYTTIPRVGGNYTLPKNLGRNINTQGDDISPFYHVTTATLYFSSNGRVSAGGLDIFKSKGDKLQWEVAQNLGFPINSSADDLYYTISEPHGGGYLVSNRSFLPQRPNTTDDDIFYFAQQNIYIQLSGKISNATQTESLLAGANIKLFEITSDNEELINENILEDGVYLLDLEPNKSYVLSFQKEGFETTTFPIKTANQSTQLAHDIALVPLKKEVAAPNWDKIKYEIVPASYNSNENAYTLPKEPLHPHSGQPYTDNYLIVYQELKEIALLGDEHKLYYDEGGNPQPYRLPLLSMTETNPQESETTNPSKQKNTAIYEVFYNENEEAEEGVVYKIQVAAVRKFRPYKFENLKKVGRLAMENIAGDIRRVMVVDKTNNKEGIEGFKSKAKALNVLSYILNNSPFQYAFVIKYINGKRVGDGFRGWDEEEGLKTSPKVKAPKDKDKYQGF